MFNDCGALGLIGTFLTVVLFALAVEMGLSARRRLSVLRTQVGDVSETVSNLRQEQLNKSPLERLVLPFAGKVVSSITRLTPLDLHGRTNRLIVLAGSLPGLTAERIVAFKIVFAVVGLVVGLAVGSVLPVSGFLKVGTIVLFALFGYTIPSAAISPGPRSARRRSARRCPTPWTCSRSASRPASASIRRSPR